MLFESLAASIVTASVDDADEMKLVAEGKCFPYREKAMPFTVCHGVTHEISQTVGAYSVSYTHLTLPTIYSV